MFVGSAAAIIIPSHVQHKSSSLTRNFHPLKFIPVQTGFMWFLQVQILVKDNSGVLIQFLGDHTPVFQSP